MKRKESIMPRGRLIGLLLCLLLAVGGLTGCPTFDKTIEDDADTSDDDNDDNDSATDDDDDDNDNDDTAPGFGDYVLWAMGRDQQTDAGVLLVSDGESWFNYPLSPDLPGESWNLIAGGASAVGRGMLVGNIDQDGSSLGFGLRVKENALTPEVPSFQSDDWEVSGVSFLPSGTATLGWIVATDLDDQVGAIFRLSTDDWNQEDITFTGEKWSLAAISMLDQYTGFAFGSITVISQSKTNGLALRKSGSTWVRKSLLPGLLNSWALKDGQMVDETNVWAVGAEEKLVGKNSGLVLHGDGADDWSQFDVPDIGSQNWLLNSVSFVSPIFGFAVGDDLDNDEGVILVFDGPVESTSWEKMTVLGLANTWSAQQVEMRSNTDGYLVGYTIDTKQGLLLHFNGDAWKVVSLDSVYQSSDWMLSGFAFVP